MKKLFLDQPLEERFMLPEDKAHHVVHVLRHDFKKPLIISDGQGKTGAFLLSLGENNTTQADLVHWVANERVSSNITLIQAFLKGEKFELVLQKVTELGCEHIFGIKTAHCVAKYDSQKLKVKETRWRKILIEASQQSNAIRVPTLDITTSLENIVASYDKPLLLVAYENEDNYSLKEALQDYREQHEVLVLIGPEGGFSSKEIEAFQALGFISVTLGQTILRAETAAIAAVTMINYERNM